MVERDTGRSLLFRVPDRQWETLVTRLVREFIEPGTVIISDKLLPSTEQHHRGTLESSEKEAEGDEWDRESQTTKLPWRVQLE